MNNLYQYIAEIPRAFTIRSVHLHRRIVMLTQQGTNIRFPILSRLIFLHPPPPPPVGCGVAVSAVQHCKDILLAKHSSEIATKEVIKLVAGAYQDTVGVIGTVARRGCSLAQRIRDAGSALRADCTGVWLRAAL